MSLTRYNPRGLTPWFDLDRFFDNFDRSLATAPFRGATGQAGWAPAVDVFEDDKEIVLTADLPDMDQKDLDIHVEDNHLTIQGERKFENEEKKDHYHRIERRYGSFQRTFALPDTVDGEHIVAKYDKGVLKVTLPKLEKPKNARTIQVK